MTIEMNALFRFIYVGIFNFEVTKLIAACWCLMEKTKTSKQNEIKNKVKKKV